MRRLVALVAIAVSLAACSSGGTNAVVSVASHPAGIGTGLQRIMFGLIDGQTNEFLASPNLEAVVTLRDENGAPLETVTAEFLWLVPNVRGIYSVYLDLAEEGLYQLTVNTGGDEVGPVGVTAMADPVVVVRGESAPLSVTRTSADHELGDITSDPEPDPAFYELSVSDAIEAGPTVIVFATPAWCTSAACGPMLDQVKDLAPAFPDLNFVHVEIYEDINVSSFEDLVFVDAVREWGLPSEPWVFVVNGEGIVAASFEGAVSGEELLAAFAAVRP